jgi:hypothetical protein
MVKITVHMLQHITGNMRSRSKNFPKGRGHFDDIVFKKQSALSHTVRRYFYNFVNTGLKWIIAAFIIASFSAEHGIKTRSMLRTSKCALTSCLAQGFLEKCGRDIFPGKTVATQPKWCVSTAVTSVLTKL